jgi:hypothetical protein
MRTAFPIHNFVEGGHTFRARGGGVAHLTILKINARFFSARPSELQHGSRATDALELDDIGDMQIAQGALEARHFRLAGWEEERFGERDEIAARERFLEKMNRAQTATCSRSALKWVAVRMMARAVGWLVRRS